MTPSTLPPSDRPASALMRALSRERGIALIVGLIILAVLSMIGVAAFSVSTQEERMAGNSRERIRAFEAAEAALRNCESIVVNNATAFAGATTTTPAPNTPGMYLAPQDSSTATALEQDPLDLEATWQTSKTAVSQLPAASFPSSAFPPACVAEWIRLPNSTFTPGSRKNSTNTVSIAHITAHGYGRNANTVVRLESYYAM
ncbi:MAG: hypothetical protein JO133_02425 [Burkholderiaceae bacterium]|nr:hypothetical protein [Burkholderiaceae bacterium]